MQHLYINLYNDNKLYNFTIFFAWSIFIFKRFSTNIKDFCIFIWFICIFICSFINNFISFLFKINYLYCMLSLWFTKYFHTIFTSVHIIFHVFKWQYCRHYRIWWNIFTYFWTIKIIFTFIYYFNQRFEIYINNNRWSLIRFLALIKL